MGLFSGVSLSITNPINLAQLAAGPAGWASLAASSLLSSFGQNIIQQLGTSLGVPQPMIDLAQAQFATSFGDYNGAFTNLNEAFEGIGAQLGASPAEIGQAQADGQTAADNIAQMFQDQIAGTGDDETQGSASAQGGSLLMKIAVSLGKLLDQKMTDMANISDEIGSLGSGPDNQSKLGQLTGELQGLSQETNMLSNALTNTIKSIGEANTTLARKG